MVISLFIALCVQFDDNSYNKYEFLMVITSIGIILSMMYLFSEWLDKC